MVEKSKGIPDNFPVKANSPHYSDNGEAASSAKLDCFARLSEEMLVQMLSMVCPTNRALSSTEQTIQLHHSGKHWQNAKNQLLSYRVLWKGRRLALQGCQEYGRRATKV